MSFVSYLVNNLYGGVCSGKPDVSQGKDLIILMETSQYDHISW